MKKSDIVAFEKELRPILEEEIDRAEILKAMAKAARDKGIDWAQFKKLVKARIEDSREGSDKRVAAIIEKADFAASYADMLGFASNMNNQEKSCSSEPEAPKPTQKPVQQSEPEPASRTILREQLTASIAQADSDDLEIPDFLRRTEDSPP